MEKEVSHLFFSFVFHLIEEIDFRCIISTYAQSSRKGVWEKLWTMDGR